MSMPISRFLLVACVALALGSCGKDDGQALKEAEKQAEQDAIADGKIECALAGTTSFERVCTTERRSTEGGQLLVIRHPDGGFRRFRVLTNGKGLEAADGFDPTYIDPVGTDMIEVKSADDRYRLPARMKSDAAPPAKAK